MKIFIVACCMAILGLLGSAIASEPSIGVVKTVKGSAAIERNGNQMAAEIGQRLSRQDILTTGSNGAMGIILKDNSVLSIGPDTRLQISEFDFEPAENRYALVADMKKGTAAYLSGLIVKLKKDAIQFKTPTAVCGIRGTHFAVKVR